MFTSTHHSQRATPTPLKDLDIDRALTNLITTKMMRLCTSAICFRGWHSSHLSGIATNILREIRCVIKGGNLAMLLAPMVCMYALSVLPCYSQSNLGYISGSVINTQGVGIKARIIAYRKMATDGEPRLSEECSTITSANGQFSCSTLPIGSYIVEEISPTNAASCKNHDTFNGDVLFYPGVSNLADAESIIVTSQSSPWVEIQEGDSPATSISGTLAAGLPHVTFDLSAIGMGTVVHLDYAVRYVSKTGRFELLGIMPGRYSLRATWMLDQSKHSAFAVVSLGEYPVADLHLTPIEEATISGSIEAPDQINASMIELRLLGVASSPIQVPIKKGRFQIDNLKTGKYEMTVIGRGNTYIGSMSWDGHPTMNVPYFRVAQGGAHVLNIVLAGPAGEIVGNLARSSFSKNMGNADVIAVSEATDIVYYRLANHYGEFSFSGLPPGFYRLYAWSRPNQAPFRISSFREQYRDDSQQVFVEAGALEEVSDLHVIEQTP